MKSWMKSLKHLSWLTQAGVSIAAPLLLCLAGSLWLQHQFSLGVWMPLLGVALGLGGAASSLVAFFRVIQKEAAKDKKAPPSSFNH